MQTRRSVRALIALAAPVVAAAIALHAAPAALASDELAIGAKGPGFNLKGTDGKMHALESVAGPKGTAVIFTCNECPFSKGYEDRLIALAKTYQPQGVGFVAINANDPKIVPGDGFEFMVKRAQDKVKARDFATALDSLVSGKPVQVAETKAFGCGVKYAKK